MARRFDSLVYPGGRLKAFTLSYDDGVFQDRRLVALFNKYNLKATFNLNYGTLGKKEILGGKFDVSKIDKEEVVELYKGHEVAGHMLYHSLPTGIKSPLLTYEIIEDKKELERLTGTILRMFAYPFGIFNNDTKEALRLAGYKGARTIKSTHEFRLPEDTLEWNPTCHHDDKEVFELLDKFVNGMLPGASLFYLWGHAYEFDGNNNWEHIEKICQYIDEHREGIWFCTNGELLDYLNAYSNLVYSVDGSMIFNPSSIDVEIMLDFGKNVVISAGKTVTVE